MRKRQFVLDYLVSQYASDPWANFVDRYSWNLLLEEEIRTVVTISILDSERKSLYYRALADCVQKQAKTHGQLELLSQAEVLSFYLLYKNIAAFKIPHEFIELA